jgi:hypothetical protein
LHKFEDKTGHYCFIAIEPQYEAKKCIVKEYLLEAQKGKNNRENELNKQSRMEKRTYQLSQSIGEIADDLIVPFGDIFPTSSQISSIFRLDTFVEKRLDEQLSCWLRRTCPKVMISLFMLKEDGSERG